MPILAAAVAIGVVLWLLASKHGLSGPSPAQNAQTMNQLLLAMHDPTWQSKVQASLMNDNDAVGLDIQAATVGIAEPSGAQALRIKVAALQGKSVYSPPALPAAVDDPSVYDVFPTGQYQGCDASSACDPMSAKYGSGTGPLGLDAGLTSLDDDAAECISYLLQAYPDSWSKEFPLSTAIQGDMTGTLLQAINGVENVVRASFPMLATVLRYKARFLAQNKATLEAQAQAAVKSGQPMTSFSPPTLLHGPGFGPPPQHAAPASTWFQHPAPSLPLGHMVPAQPPPLGHAVEQPPGAMAKTAGATKDHTAWVRTHAGVALTHVKPRWIGSRVHVLGLWPEPVIARARRTLTKKHINF